MRVSCSCPVDKASDGLIAEIGKLGITPIVTSTVVRAVYEGPDMKLGEKIVRLFEAEVDHEIVADYDKKERGKKEQKKKENKKRKRKR